MTTKQLIEQTKQLIAIQSTADNPAELRAAVEFVAEMIRARCPEVTIEWFEQNGKPSFLAYRGKTRPEKFDVLLNAHVDVVPAPPKQFKPYEKDGKLYGRGALDMKGTTVVLADVFCELVDQVPHELGLQVVCDEEIGGYDGVVLQLQDGVRANFVIMGEYANDAHTIYNAARGICWAEIAFKGKSAHGGHLWHGANAVIKAGDFAGAVLKHYPTPDKETWTTTASIASLSTPNETYNKVPDTAILKIDFRFTQEDPVFHNRESLEAFIHDIDPEATLVNLATFEPAVDVDELNPYVQGLSAALRSVTGAKPQFLGRPAGSDGRHFAMVQNDIVEFGLLGQSSHSAQEYVETKSFGEYQAILQTFLRQPIPARLKKAKTPPKPKYIWYATYGSGLSKQNFICQIRGGTPEGSTFTLPGCTDTTPPQGDTFISLPYGIYFSGHCQSWGDGGHISIELEPSASAHTIARAYLITTEQFTQIAAQQNYRTDTQPLPFQEAIAQGHATVGDGSGHYDELVFCGNKDGLPIFTLASVKPDLPYTPPNPAYTRLLCQGLSENTAIGREAAINYVLDTPGITGNYNKQDITKFFTEAAPDKAASRTPAHRNPPKRKN